MARENPNPKAGERRRPSSDRRNAMKPVDRFLVLDRKHLHLSQRHAASGDRRDDRYPLRAATVLGAGDHARDGQHSFRQQTGEGRVHVARHRAPRGSATASRPACQPPTRSRSSIARTASPSSPRGKAGATPTSPPPTGAGSKRAKKRDRSPICRPASPKQARLPSRVVEHASADETERAYLAATDEARRHGIFGSPTFDVEGELFWGDDRLEDAIAWRERGRLVLGGAPARSIARAILRAAS